MTIETPVRAIFTYTREEYILAMRRHYRSNLKAGRDVVAGLVAILGGVLLLFTMDSSWLGWSLLIAGTALLSIAVYAILLFPTLIYSSQPKLKDEYSLTFTDAGIGFKTKNIDAVLQWSTYHSWLSDDAFYIMYHGKRELSVIPRRALENSFDDRLRELLTKKLGPPKHERNW